jgi:hypothetical protein
MRVFNSIIIFLFLILCNDIYAQEQLKNRYDDYLWHFVNSKEVRTTYYRLLLETDTKTLSDLSKRQHRNTLDVYENPDDEELKLKFITEFPKDFKTFLSIFHRNDLRELYDNSHIYLGLLKHLSDEYPDKVVYLLFGLSRDAKWDADATGDLQGILTEYIINHFELFITPFKKLPIREQKNISVFLADVETIATYPEFKTILNLLKKHNETKLYEMFLNSKKERMRKGH